MKNYTKPEMVIAFFEAEDVISLSVVNSAQVQTGIKATVIDTF